MWLIRLPPVSHSGITGLQLDSGSVGHETATVAALKEDAAQSDLGTVGGVSEALIQASSPDRAAGCCSAAPWMRPWSLPEVMRAGANIHRRRDGPARQGQPARDCMTRRLQNVSETSY